MSSARCWKVSKVRTDTGPKADYGEALLADLAKRLTAEFGTGYSGTNLRWFRQFYLEYQNFLPKEIHHAPRDKSISLRLAGGKDTARAACGIRHWLRTA